MSKPVLEIENLSVSFMTRTAEVPAVMDFSMEVNEGDAMGLVGESGCGKSTVALAIMNYLGGNGKIVGGSIKYRGRDMSTFSEKELENKRRRLEEWLSSIFSMKRVMTDEKYPSYEELEHDTSDDSTHGIFDPYVSDTLGGEAANMDPKLAYNNPGT